MWYVVQTHTGDEADVSMHVKNEFIPEYCRECFVPFYEEVRRKKGQTSIIFRRLFPGYLFVDTDDPEKLYYEGLKKLPGFTRILGEKEDDDSRLFIPITPQDEEFLKSILEDGVMHVSYIKTSNKNRVIERIVGPLAKYKNHIVKIDTQHREAIVETDMFGKKRKICFGIWKDGDPKLPWLERRMKGTQDRAIDEGAPIDIGIAPGDKVVDTTGLYEGMIFVVEKVNPKQRTLKTKIDIFMNSLDIELFVDDVKKVGE